MWVNDTKIHMEKKSLEDVQYWRKKNCEQDDQRHQKQQTKKLQLPNLELLDCEMYKRGKG